MRNSPTIQCVIHSDRCRLLIGACVRGTGDRESAVDAERVGLLDKKKVGKHNRKVRMLFSGR